MKIASRVLIVVVNCFLSRRLGFLFFFLVGCFLLYTLLFLNFGILLRFECSYFHYVLCNFYVFFIVKALFYYIAVWILFFFFRYEYSNISTLNFYIDLFI